MHNYTQAHQSAQDAPKPMRRRLSPAEQIAAARDALARAQRRQRAHDTRSKIVLGGLTLTWVRRDRHAAQALLKHINSNPPRRQDMDALSEVRAELISITRSNGASGNGHAQP